MVLLVLRVQQVLMEQTEWMVLLVLLVQQVQTEQMESTEQQVQPELRVLMVSTALLVRPARQALTELME